MTPEDVKIIFGNIEKLAAFSEEFARQLEPALGEVVEGGEGEDSVGRLFLDFVRPFPVCAFISRPGF